jgi:uncharacterized MAPEG superfamily protein
MMAIPVWVLLGFAAWTLVLLVGTVGVYRWRRILLGRANIRDWRADEPQGNERYRRAMRAHMNCVENLPVYAAVVVATLATGVHSPWLDGLAIILLVARISQSIMHVALEPTELIAGTRFVLFAVQVVCMAWMGIYVAVNA